MLAHDRSGSIGAVGGLLHQYLRHLPAYAASAASTWRDLSTRLERYGIDGRGSRLLEVGCGHSYPYVALSHSQGARIVGIDVLPLVRRGFRASRYGGIWRKSGPVPALRRAVGDIMHSVAFYGPLGRAADVRMAVGRTPLARMDGGRMGFADGSFDFIFSSACFEHLPDVPAVVQEMDRVLKRTGIAEIEIHLFASMTGGHDAALFDHRPPPPGFPRWQHLLDPSWRPSMYLNRWREAQFHEAFAARFRVVDVRVTSDHGRQYLTPEILGRLTPRYTAEELARESVLFVLRPR